MRVDAKRRQSRLAIWSRRAALLAIPILLAAIVGHRTDVIDAQPTLALLALGLTLALCAVLAAILGFVTIWREARAGFGAALVGLVLGAALLAYPALLFSRLFTLPAIADVTTDPEDLPAFTAVDWDHAAPTARQIAAQEEAYPEVVPHVYAADPVRVFEEVAALVGERGWQIDRQEPPVLTEATPEPVPAASTPASAEPPAPASPSAASAVSDAAATPVAEGAIEPAESVFVTPGFVEAEARTLIVGFREDVVIRVSAGPAGAIVDMRSASRVFAHDFGSDARRIESFLSDLDARLPLVTSD